MKDLRESLEVCSHLLLCKLSSAHLVFAAYMEIMAVAKTQYGNIFRYIIKEFRANSGTALIVHCTAGKVSALWKAPAHTQLILCNLVHARTELDFGVCFCLDYVVSMKK